MDQKFLRADELGIRLEIRCKKTDMLVPRLCGRMPRVTLGV